MIPWARLAIPSALIVFLVFLAYLPALHGGFIWDDDVYVTNNPLLTAPDGLRRIWFTLDSPSQYFPLTYTVFRIERSLWGLDPTGYHCVNILLHAINALLVGLVLQRLSVPGAWLAAALFALHPVQVEAVAWITELKSVLSLFFILLALFCWIEFIGERSRRFWYWLAMVFYALALFSKTTACTLPAALLLILWLKTKPIDWRRLAQVVPFLAMGLGMGLLTVWWERFHQDTQGQRFGMGLLERTLVASHALWFYAGKLFWPVNLTFSYPRWTIDPANPSAYGWLVMAIGLGAAIYSTRRFFGRSVEVATLFYVATLSPLLGFIMLCTFFFTFVADHYQYVASIGLIALAAAGITIAFKTKPFLKLACCGTLLLTLGILTWQQAGIYRNQETLWRDTLAKNPGSWMAHINLGVLLGNQGRIEEAMEHYHKAVQINPNYYLAYHDLSAALVAKGRLDEAIENYRKAIQHITNNPAPLNDLGVALAAQGRWDEAIKNYRKAIQMNPNFSDALGALGVALAAQGRFDEAIQNYRKAIQTNPNNLTALNDLGAALAAEGRLDEAIGNFRKAIQINPNLSEALDNLGMTLATEGRLDEAIENYRKAIKANSNPPETFFHLGMTLHQLGRTREAIAQYRQALRLNPNLTGPLNNLAWVLAAGPDAGLRNGPEAVRLAQRACELTHYGEPMFIATLAAAFAEAGRFDDAVATAQKARTVALAQGEKEIAAQDEQLLELFKSGQAYHQDAKPAP
ncbi:MAG: tetratricopeptide repeat protein [Verrucomicrobiota bacterium]|jgi:tetratricopeptide (TPR) repeat protein